MGSVIDLHGEAKGFDLASSYETTLERAAAMRRVTRIRPEIGDDVLGACLIALEAAELEGFKDRPDWPLWRNLCSAITTVLDNDSPDAAAAAHEANDTDVAAGRRHEAMRRRGALVDVPHEDSARTLLDIATKLRELAELYLEAPSIQVSAAERARLGYAATLAAEAMEEF